MSTYREQEESITLAPLAEQLADAPDQELLTLNMGPHHPATHGVLRLLVTLDIVPDEFDPHALLAAQDEFGDPVAQVKVRPDFKLTMASASAWIEAEFRKP